MASPEGLRLYFGSRLPIEVLENIFGYGFHIWLATPFDVVTNIELEYGVHRAYSTRHAVAARQLSEKARKLVQFERYWESIFDAPRVEFFPVGPARPVVWDNLMWWMPPYRGCEEQWALPNLPRYYDAVDSDEWDDHDGDDSYDSYGDD